MLDCFPQVAQRNPPTRHPCLRAALRPKLLRFPWIASIITCLGNVNGTRARADVLDEPRDDGAIIRFERVDEPLRAFDGRCGCRFHLGIIYFTIEKFFIYFHLFNSSRYDLSLKRAVWHLPQYGHPSTIYGESSSSPCK